MQPSHPSPRPSPLVVYKYDKSYLNINQYCIAIEPKAEYGKPFDPDHSHRIYYRFYEDAFFGFPDPAIGFAIQLLNFDYSPSPDASSLRCVSNDKSFNEKLSVVLDCRAVEDGVDLHLTLKNLFKNYTWPAIAGFAGCLTPGNTRGEPINAGVGNTEPPICNNFADNGSRYTPTPAGFVWQFGPEPPSKTWFLAPDGLRKLITNRFHFNFTFKEPIERLIHSPGPSRLGIAPHLTDNCPMSEVCIQDGLMLRQSNDGWVVAIAWPANHALSVQGNNPQKCMHLSIRPGVVGPSEQIEIRGKIYLFKGTIEECLRRYRADFDSDPPIADLRLANDALDASSNALHGRLEGNAHFAGDALALDGRAAYLRIPGFKGVPAAHARTISAWIRTDAPGDIISWGSDDAGGQFRLWLNDNFGNPGLGPAGALALDVAGGCIVGAAPLTDNRWRHVAAVLPQDAHDVSDARLYVDGQPQPIALCRPQPIDTAEGYDVTIGVNSYIGLAPRTRLDEKTTEKLAYRYQFQRTFFKGLIRRVRLYTRALSPQEIAQQFSDGPA